MTTLSPEYLSTDFNTIITAIKADLAESDTFADYDYEGSNIAILIELMAYIGDLSTFFINKVARNTNWDTADVYEAVNALARQVGYEPKGNISARNTLSVTVTGCTIGDQISFQPWKQLDSGRTYSGDNIKFATTAQSTYTATATSETFSVPIRQGEIITLSGYDNNDLIDNELLLPEGYAYDGDIDDTLPSVKVSVGPSGDLTEWSRITDFYDDLSGLYTEDQVYMFIYDKYNRNKVVFNSARSVPGDSDVIEIKTLKSLGVNGAISTDSSSDSWDILDTGFLEINGIAVANTRMTTVTCSNASTSSADPETIDIIKTNSRTALHAQFRDVTGSDYESYLSAKSDIVAANAWGEYDIAPSGSVLEYNRTHVSVIPLGDTPNDWSTSSITTSAGTLTTTWGNTGTIYRPVAYDSDWQDEISTYLEPRKMLCVYEEFELPELVYFGFEFGIRKKRTYTLSDITTDITNKLTHWFRPANRDFGEKINFMDIIEYILDDTEVSSSDTFSNIKGIRNLILRDIDISVTLYEPNNDFNYPQYTVASYSGENTLRPIQLSENQFPVLADPSNIIKYTEET